jgi:hypothetical protein
MNKHLHFIEDLFRTALDDHKEIPPASVWHSVEHNLDQDSLLTIQKKYYHLKSVVLLFLFLLIGFGLYELNNGSTNKLSDTGRHKTATETGSIQHNKQETSINQAMVPLNPQQSIKQESIKDKPNRIPATLTSAKDFSTLPNQTPLTTKQTETTYHSKDTRLGNEHNNTTVKNAIDKTAKPSTVYHRVSSVPLQKAIPSAMLHAEQAERKGNILPITTNILPLSVGSLPVRSSRFSVTAFYSPDIATYKLEDENDNVNQPDDADEIKNTEQHEFSSTAGVLLGYDVGSRWTIQTGLTFSNFNIAIDPKTVYAQADNTGSVKYRLNFSSGYGYLAPSFQPSPIIGDSLKIIDAEHELRYLNVPIAVQYTLSHSKLKIVGMTGVRINFLLDGKLETELQKGANNEIEILNDIEGLRKAYWDGLIGIGAGYKLPGRISFEVMPVARFALNAMNKGGVVKTYPRSFGLSAGLKYRFR